MSTVTSAVPQAVPSAVAPSPSTSVAIDTKPQLGPYTPMKGSSVVPAVPVSGEPEESPASPGYGGADSTGEPSEGGGKGAPSVPAMGGVLFRRQAADPHYLVADEGDVSPYKRVNSPPTRGMVTWVKAYLNHVFQGAQNVDSAGWQQPAAQQRTSYMRITPPPVADGYDPQSFTPHQLPQNPYTQRFLPTLGNDQPGVNVMNRTTYGAGQTAGGQGGNQYTPQPGPPDTTSTAQAQQAAGGMPTWG